MLSLALSLSLSLFLSLPLSPRPPSGEVCDEREHHPGGPAGATAPPGGGRGEEHRGQGGEGDGHREGRTGVKTLNNSDVREMLPCRQLLQRIQQMFSRFQTYREHCTVGQVLAEITQTWSVMALSYETHANTGTPLLKADENLIETLEDNQVSVCCADSLKSFLRVQSRTLHTILGNIPTF